MMITTFVCDNQVVNAYKHNTLYFMSYSDAMHNYTVMAGTMFVLFISMDTYLLDHICED